MSVALRVLGSLALAGAVAAGNVARETCWSQADGFLCGPFASRPLETLVSPVPVSGLTRLEIPAPHWRPLSIAVRVEGPASARLSGTGVEVPGIAATGRVTSFVTRQAPLPTERVQLWVEPAVTGTTTSLRIATLTPILEAAPLLRALALGAAAGAALAWLLWFCPWSCRRPMAFWTRADASADSPRDPTRGAADARPQAASFAVPLTVLAIVHGAWIVLKPPFQSPDEPQHHARATSALHTPYVAGARSVPLAAAHRNPLTWTPNRLHAIIFQPGERLTDADVRALRGTTWLRASPYPAVEAVPSPVASYPGLYYWLVFAGGELATAMLALSPYVSLLAYRAASVAIAAVVWLAIYAQLRRTPDLRAWALPAFVLLAANPVTASITASVNPDALVIPATVLLLLATWRRLTAGGPLLPVVASAVLAVAVKPSGMIAVAVAIAGVLWWVARHRQHPAVGLGTLRPLAVIALAAFALFYAWSPPTLVLERSHAGDSLAAYAASVLARAPSWWVEYWGRLGWVEYSASAPYYWLLLTTCLVLAVAAWRRPSPSPGIDAFAVITGVTYAALLLASEYVHLLHAPLFVQGRYLLPASLTFVPLVRQRSRTASWLLPTVIVALNVALAHATVTRYFQNGWDGWVASMR